MNFPKSVLAFAITTLLLASCKDTASEPKPDNASEPVATVKKTAINPEKLETATFNIEGMTCAIGCAKTIEKELTELDGVQKATVDFDKKEATVLFDSTIQTPASLTKIVEATGDGQTYKVSNMKS